MTKIINLFMKVISKPFFYKLYAKLFAKPCFYEWNNQLLRFAVRGLGILNFYDDKLSGEFHFINNILSQILGEKPMLFDVGANIGLYSKALLNKFPNAELHLFEPHPLNFLKLEGNISFGQCYVNNIALSNDTGMIKLYDYKERDGSTHASLSKEVIEEIHGKESIYHEIKRETLDIYVEKKNISQIDLLKIDVEGHELSVLKGAKKVISENKIKIIHFEFNEMNIESKSFLKDFFKILNQYSLFRLLPNALLPLTKYAPISHELFAYQNIVAIRNDIKMEL